MLKCDRCSSSEEFFINFVINVYDDRVTHIQSNRFLCKKCHKFVWDIINLHAFNKEGEIELIKKENQELREQIKSALDKNKRLEDEIYELRDNHENARDLKIKLMQEKSHLENMTIAKELWEKRAKAKEKKEWCAHILKRGPIRIFDDTYKDPEMARLSFITFYLDSNCQKCKESLRIE